MLVSTSYELHSFWCSIVIGLTAGIICDFIKSLNLKRRAVSDGMLWLFLISGVGFLWLRLLGGALRWYIITGTILSFILYRYTLGKPVFFIFSFVVKKIYCFFNIILKILLTARDFLCKIIGIYRAKSINNKEVTVNEKA